MAQTHTIIQCPSSLSESSQSVSIQKEEDKEFHYQKFGTDYKGNERETKKRIIKEPKEEDCLV